MTIDNKNPIKVRSCRWTLAFTYLDWFKFKWQFYVYNNPFNLISCRLGLKLFLVINFQFHPHARSFLSLINSRCITAFRGRGEIAVSWINLLRLMNDMILHYMMSSLWPDPGGLLCAHAGPPQPRPALPRVTHDPGGQATFLLGPLLPLQLDAHSTLLLSLLVTRILDTGLPWHSLALMSRLGFSPRPLDNFTSHHLDIGASLAGSWYHKIRELHVFSLLLGTFLNFLRFAFRVVLLDSFILHGVWTLSFKSGNNDT